MQREAAAVPLSVIGPGFGRTGTLSLKLALEQLGLGPCHHMMEVAKSPQQLRYWQDAAAGRPVDWEQVFADYRSTADWPSAHYWQELSAAFPEAKVILTVRPEQGWWASFSQTILPLMQRYTEIPDPHVRSVLAMGTAIVAEQTMSGRPEDEATALAAYRRRMADVTAEIAPERLLVFDVADGWQPLCRFLGLPVPDMPFPRTHSVDEFWQMVQGAGEANAAASS
jgi:hypothetical protein